MNQNNNQTPQKETENNELNQTSDNKETADIQFEYLGIADLLKNNEVQFPSNSTRLAEAMTIAQIMAKPFHNNIMLLVNKTEDAMPALILLEKLFQVAHKQTNPDSDEHIPFALMHATQFIPPLMDFHESPEPDDEVHAKLDQLFEDIMRRRCVPVLADITSFFDDPNYRDKVEDILSQPQSVICILQNDAQATWDKIVKLEKPYELNFASSGRIIRKTALDSFTNVSINPLSFEEICATLSPYIVSMNELTPKMFSPETIETILAKGYETYPHTTNINDIQKVFHFLSLNASMVGQESVALEDINQFFEYAQKEKAVSETEQNAINCETFLNQKILGQEEALHKISEIIQSKAFSLDEDKRPTVLGFFGPSGVGKTATAEALGPFLSGQKSTLINMAEYQESHTVSKLIGSPPGYVGSEKSGLLYEIVKENPKAVLILDEIEKAHPSVHKLFLGIFDKGVMHDSYAGDIDLSQTTIILTSNEGIKEVAGLGFGNNSGQVSYEVDKAAVEKAFAPEFMGRLDDMVIFKPLNKNVLSQIIDLSLKPIQKKLAQRFNVSLSLGDGARNQLIQEGSNPRYGARPIKNLLKTKITAPLSLQLHQGKFPATSQIVADFDKTTQNYVLSRRALAPNEIQHAALSILEQKQSEQQKINS